MNENLTRIEATPDFKAIASDAFQKLSPEAQADIVATVANLAKAIAVGPTITIGQLLTGFIERRLQKLPFIKRHDLGIQSHQSIGQTLHDNPHITDTQLVGYLGRLLTGLAAVGVKGLPD